MVNSLKNLLSLKNNTVTILGSNSATPTSTRFSSAQVLNMGQQLYMIDCCEGAQIQLRKFHIPMQRINHIFISHLHADHYLGVIGLIFTLSLLGRKNPLSIYSPPGLSAVVEAHMALSNSPLSYEVSFYEITDKKAHVIYTDDKLTVTAFPLLHSLPTYGYLFEEKPKKRKVIKEAIKKYKIPVSSMQNLKNGLDYVTEAGEVIPNKEITEDPSKQLTYAYCSDTAYEEQIIPIIQGVDLLYHEATFMEDRLDAAISKMHSTAKQAATIAKMAEVKKLVIGHYSSRYSDVEPLLLEAKKVFLNTKAVHDGDELMLS